jgi:hypothetical protein
MSTTVTSESNRPVPPVRVSATAKRLSLSSHLEHLLLSALTPALVHFSPACRQSCARPSRMPRSASCTSRSTKQTRAAAILMALAPFVELCAHACAPLRSVVRQLPAAQLYRGERGLACQQRRGQVARVFRGCLRRRVRCCRRRRQDRGLFAGSEAVGVEEREERRCVERGHCWRGQEQKKGEEVRVRIEASVVRPWRPHQEVAFG